MSEKEQAEKLNRPDEWFVYDPFGPDFQTYQTEEEARQIAQEILDALEEASDEGWDEATAEVCWGKISQRAVLVSSEPAPNEDWPPFDKYELK